MLQKFGGELDSRAVLSMAAPTVETFSNGDNISDDRSMYKAGRINCERTTTLAMNDRSPAHSPRRSKN